MPGITARTTMRSLAVLEAWLSQRALPLVVAAVVVFLAAYAPFALTWPPVSSDEGREVNAFWVGAGVDPSAQLLDPFYGRDPLYKGGVQGLSVSLALRLAGLSLSAARLVSTFWAALLLIATFLAASRLFGAAAAAAATAVLAASYPLLFSAHFVRPDIVVAALVMIALWLALASDDRGVSHVLSGLLLGLALDVHPYSAAFIPLFAINLLLRPYAQRIRTILWFALGSAAGVAVYLIGRVAPSVSNFVNAVRFWVGVEMQPPLLTNGPIAMLTAELSRFGSYWSERPLEAAVVLVCTAWGVWRAARGSRAHRVVLGGLLGTFLVFCALVDSKVPYYLILYYGLFCMLIGAALADFAKRTTGRLPLGVCTVAAIALFGFGLVDYGRDLVYRYRSDDHDFPHVQQQFDNAVPRDAVVIGKPVFWLALSDRRFVDIAVATRLATERGMSFGQFVEASGATIVLVDTDTRDSLSGADKTWLNDHFVTREVIEEKYYGSVDVRHRGTDR